MPRTLLHAAEVEELGPLTEHSPVSGTYGTRRVSPRGDTSTSGPPRGSLRGKCRPKRCTVRKTIKLSPEQAGMLDELAAANGTTGCALLKSLLLRAYLEMQARK